MNFYESARFQYAAARLMVKLSQFRQKGRFTQKITYKTNFDIRLVTQSDGSFNVNVESPDQEEADEQFIKVSLADLIAYISERIIEKIDETTLSTVAASYRRGLVVGSAEVRDPARSLDEIVSAAMADRAITAGLPSQVQDLIRRRVAEAYREQRLAENQSAIARIDSARSQKLIAMSAPLISEMATALRRSANTLEVRSQLGSQNRTVLVLDRKMAEDIETAIVDEDITPILGDITQFNKDNGWGKLKIEKGTKTVSFSIPSDILPLIKQTLIDNMKRDLVYLQTYFVRDPSREVVRLIVVGILPTPAA